MAKLRITVEPNRWVGKYGGVGSTWLYRVLIEGCYVGLGSEAECEALAAELREDATKARVLLDFKAGRETCEA